MKTKSCERCGKEIGFFDFKHELKNNRIDLHYDNLCSQCHRILSEGIDCLDKMYEYMIKTLRERYHFDNMAAVDLDTLIFLAVEAVFSLMPDYSKRDSKINQALINCSERSSGPEEDLIKIVEYLIDYGFSINKKNVQVHDFRGYLKKTTLFVEQIGMNSKEDIPKVYYHLFLSCRGLVAAHMETGESFSVPISEDSVHAYQLSGSTEIHLTSLFYPDRSDKSLILFTLNEDQTKLILKAFDHFNDVSQRRKERKRRDTMALISRGIYKDLKKISSAENFSDIPVDCLLIFIVKNMMSDAEGKNDTLFSENGLLMDILFENFYENLVQFGRTSRSDVLDYLTKNTLLSQDFNIQYEKKQEKGWAFFTTKGYILGFIESRKFVYVFEDRFPNDVYYPCNDLVYKGCRYLQLAENKKNSVASGNYRDFDGLIFFSEDVEKIGEMNRFFNLNNIFYVMDLYIEAESNIFSNRETALEVKRVSDKLFTEFSFLPFCQYDEWAAILEKLKEDDFLLCQIIDQKIHGQKYSPAASTSYTIRMIKAFNRCAKELETSLHFGDLSVAKAILWGYFNESLIDTLSREWIRIAGDIVRRGDSLVDAFSKYFNMTEIESDKSYYLGLFIYYLMSKGVLPEDDFLENYERCIPIYRNYNRRIEVPQQLRGDEERQRVLQNEVFRAVKTGEVRPLEESPVLNPTAKAQMADDEEKTVSVKKPVQEIEEEKSATVQELTNEQQDTIENKQAADTDANDPLKEAGSTENLQEEKVPISVAADDPEAEKLNSGLEEVRKIPDENKSEGEESETVFPDEPGGSETDEKEILSQPETEQISMLSIFMENELKKPSEILAEKAAKAVKNGQQVRRIIENED